MKVSSIVILSTLASTGLAFTIDTHILQSLPRRLSIEDRSVQEAAPAIAPEDILNPVVKPRECEEPAEPAEPSEAERKKGAKRPARPSRPSNC
ncbi:hypothetical protein CGCSCA5_v008613 [Colletotrichum siamense]|nr:hypothetical protein CGCSCA5_v008613 [Colletotrichum siamense]